MSAVLFGLLAHMFAYTTQLFNHDDVWELFSKGTSISSGRWGLLFVQAVFPNFSMPWIYGIITIVLFAVSICMIVRILSIRNRLSQVLISGCVIVFPGLTVTTSFFFTLSSYALAFFFAVLSVWLLITTKRKRYLSFLSFLFALGCMVFSLSIFQGYLSVTTSLLVLFLIRRLLDEKDPMPVVRQGFYFLGFLILSLLIYYGFTLGLNRLLGIEFNDYAKERITFQISDLPSDILQAYQCFVSYFTNNYHGIIPGGMSRIMHCLCLTAALILLLIWFAVQKKGQLPRLLLLAGLVGILPLAINCMCLFVDFRSAGALISFGFTAVYLLAAMMADVCLTWIPTGKLAKIAHQLALHAGTVSMALIIVVNIYLANEYYLNLYLRYENTYSFYTALAADIQMTPGFDENTQIAVIGTYTSPEFYSNFDKINQLRGSTNLSPALYSKSRFLEYLIGYPVSFVSGQEAQEIRNSDEFARMPVYPYYGSMKMIGDVYVVKLSD